MDHTRMLMIFIWIITTSPCTCVNIPFTDDFNKGMRDWTCDTKDWKHSKWNPPDTSNVPLFSSDGAYFWTDTSTQTRDSQGKNTELVSRSITPVTKATKFHFSYWFYTSNSNSTDAVGIYFYHILKNPPKQRPVDSIMVINNSSNMWEEATIDCQHQNCCQFGYDCKIVILLESSFNNRPGYSFMAIRCVSTEENGCSRSDTSGTTTAKISLGAMTTTERVTENPGTRSDEMTHFSSATNTAISSRSDRSGTTTAKTSLGTTTTTKRVTENPGKRSDNMTHFSSTTNTTISNYGVRKIPTSPLLLFFSFIFVSFKSNQ